MIAKSDPKLRHLARDRRCVFMAFETVTPFRGARVHGMSELVEGDVSSVRAAIAERYLGVDDGARFAADRRSQPGVLLRIACVRSHVWDLSGILPQ